VKARIELIKTKALETISRMKVHVVDTCKCVHQLDVYFYVSHIEYFVITGDRQ